ncbi:MAG: YbfB/YjiJ family MFS transporter [Alphaproteobacteria bacterium]|nr:YbfB/YjiJ family MFS transporter [Alphaproteobacteria bacterium]
MKSPWRIALSLSLGAALSLGITRFSYALLLPAMREDLDWSYALAGAMNTGNAAGYMVGATLMPWLMRKRGPSWVFLMGGLLASVFMAASGFFRQPDGLLVQRFLAGFASAWVFVAGGVLAARLAQDHPQQSGWLLGLYYGGTGWGIVASALIVPWAMPVVSDWPQAWWWLAAVCAVALVAMAPVAQALGAATPPLAVLAQSVDDAQWPQWRARMGWVLLGYGCFGMGYIGYMTFVIALLRQEGIEDTERTVFYTVLGLCVVASARLWADLLDRHRDGRAMAWLNALLGLATALATLSQSLPVLLLSGALFGSVFLSVVASTTAFVRHNLPAEWWVRGIGLFTVVFAWGQIVGPTVVGLIADGAGGLKVGLWSSAACLWMGALLAWRQKSLLPVK